MSRINIRQFRKSYGLELLPYALSSYQVGYKAEWENKLTKRLEVEPNYIIYYWQLESSKEDELEQSLKQLNEQPPVKASFAQLDFESKNNIGVALKMSSLDQNISAKLNLSKIEKFTFSDIQAKAITGDLYNEMFKTVLKIKNDNKDLFRRIKKLMFLEQLFYANSVELIVGNSYAAEIEAPIQNLGINAKITASDSSNKKITFTNSTDCPFATKLKDIKDLAD